MAHCHSINVGFHEKGYGQHPLHECGRWLMSIRSEDAKCLEQTHEYQEFLRMADKIQALHRNMLDSEHNGMMQDNDDTQMNSSSPKSIVGKTERKPCLSFLQHTAADDILLKIFDFLECRDLVRTRQACSRFNVLVQRNVCQRTISIAQSRQLFTVMELLRAKEQIEGIGNGILDCHVRVPTLLLSRRVVITDSGDTEYNGVYYCTGTNGNGFVFTKPRHPEQRANRRLLASSSGSLPDEAYPDSSLVETEVAQPGQLLRCIIAKRFSNETILWYLSKEVIATEDRGEVRAGDVTQVFSFWSKLMVIGDASPDICRYPSQTSILTRQEGTDGWQNLSTTRMLTPPVVELLD